MKKPTANIQSQMTQKLIYFLSELERIDREKMSTVGKNCLDNIWKLLGQPTYDKLQTHKNNEEEE